MKKFLEELDKHPNVYDQMPQSQTLKISKSMMKKYENLIGKRALYKNKATKEHRIVTIEKIYPAYLLVSYRYYGIGYSGILKTSILFRSLYCGDNTLEVEE